MSFSKRLLYVIAFLIFKFIFFSEDVTLAESRISPNCDDIYVVQPPDNEGGTFYLSLEVNPNNNRHPREGYLPAMTLIKVQREDGQLKRERLSEEHNGPKFSYVEFVGADGSFGDVKQTSISPLTNLFIRTNQPLDCKSQESLVLPISPTKEIGLYDRPSNVGISPKNIDQFSRSVPKVVLTNEKFDFWDNEDHSQQDKFYKVRFFQERRGGGTQIRDGLISASGENNIYRMVQIDSDKFQPIKVKTDESFLNKLKRFVGIWFNSYDDNELERALEKSCAGELSLKVKLKTGVNASVPFFQFGVGASGEMTYKFREGYRYTLETYSGFGTGNTSDVLKTVHCETGSTTDWYAEHLTVTGIGINDIIFETFQHQLEGSLGAYFEKPDTTGIGGTKREKMLALKKFEENSGKDYFTAFSKLNEYLEEQFFSQIALNALQRQQYNSLITRLIVDPNT